MTTPSLGREWLAIVSPIAGFAALVLVGSAAAAEDAVERGRYLVTTIIACGNCHTPKDANGQPILSRALSGGLSFETPNFSGTASNITPDLETGIGVGVARISNWP